MEKLRKWGWVIAIFLLVGMSWLGYRYMYFHQDDLDWFILANQSWRGVMMAPFADHINYVWRVLLKSEWDLFGFNFSAFFTISILMHGLVVYGLYVCAMLLGARKELATLMALLFCINTNWTETILWMSGQTIVITAIGILVVIYARVKGRGRIASLILASMTSALAIGTLGASLFVDGVDWGRRRLTRIGVALMVLGVVLGIMYATMATEGTKLEMSWRWGVNVVIVAGLAVINTALGRTLMPFDRWEDERIVVVTGLLLWLGWKYRRELVVLARDKWIKLLSFNIVFYYLTAAIGRTQYGIGVMRSERFAYIGLILILLLLARILRDYRPTKIVLAGVGLLIMGQIVGFGMRARHYVVRPTQFKVLVESLTLTNWEGVDMGAYLPYHVLNNDRLRYRDLYSVLAH